MKLNLEPEKFDKYQEILVGEIVADIKIKLQEAGLSGTQLEELTASIAFSIASTIDDTAGIESDGIEINPYLTFRTNDNEIIHYGENSFMHEYVSSTLKKLFDN